jgi:putative copper resistance protein D
VLSPALIVLRLVQFGGAMILFGSSLFLLYALPREGAGSGAQLRWTRTLLAAAAGAVLVAGLAGLVTQTSILAGSLSEGLKPDSLSAVITTMKFGPAALVRSAAAALALGLAIVLRPGRTLFGTAALLGLLINASIAWMGHGAATAGPGGSLHTGADILHVLAAAVWIGALVMFLGLLRGAGREPASDAALHRALEGFGGVGSALVAVLIATGLVNSWFLVGLDHLSGLWTTGYGQFLSLKLLLFAVMLGLAAANRFRHTPALGAALQSQAGIAVPLADLRRSVLIETFVGFVVLAVVAWLGTQEPISAMS